MDLKAEGTFWSVYDEEILRKEDVKAIIITHLYGFLHPNTNNIIEICQRNSIKLIHDAAQSFGIDENELKAAQLYTLLVLVNQLLLMQEEER
ncbi:MAG: DegT/DnrJ/EryC1/StrS family aminotransferase [Bacteroidetes bacterium]|nr:DegT/DnrJ/EryC1/StrS family aminotransferase [Bacteroidota bacterium]